MTEKQRSVQRAMKLWEPLAKQIVKERRAKACPRWEAGYPCKISRGLAYCADCGRGTQV